MKNKTTGKPEDFFPAHTLGIPVQHTRCTLPLDFENRDTSDDWLPSGSLDVEKVANDPELWEHRIEYSILKAITGSMMLIRIGPLKVIHNPLLKDEPPYVMWWIYGVPVDTERSVREAMALVSRLSPSELYARPNPSGKTCPNCNGVGWCMAPDSEGEPTPERCQRCYTSGVQKVIWRTPKTPEAITFRNLTFSKTPTN